MIKHIIGILTSWWGAAAHKFWVNGQFLGMQDLYHENAKVAELSKASANGAGRGGGGRPPAIWLGGGAMGAEVAPPTMKKRRCIYIQA